MIGEIDISDLHGTGHVVFKLERFSFPDLKLNEEEAQCVKCFSLASVKEKQ